MASKHLRLVDGREVSREALRALRHVMREIDKGLVTGISIVTVKRDGTLYSYSQSECPIKTLGALELLKEDVRAEMKRRDI